MTVGVVRPKVSTVNDLVPSGRWPNGLAALEAVLEDARSVSVAVAFVTEAGAMKLAELIGTPGEVEIEIVARAGGVTTPAALQMLRDQLGAQVSVAIGRESMRFHPKLWLARSESELTVLSGSGNLTQGGLEDNDEQFELTRLPTTSEEAAEQEERFIELTAGSHLLEDVEGTVVWSSWLTMINQSQVQRRQIRKLETRLNETPVRSKPEKERQQLLDDLYEIYHATVAKDMVTPAGKLYRPTRFLVGINRARDGGDPFELVRKLCRRQTGGFDIILEHDEPLLTVEALVLDEQKPYHRFFTEKTKELAAERLKKFPSW